MEIVVAAVVRRLTGAPRPPGSPPLRVADVGTGSGTIAVALAVALRKRQMLDEVRIVATDLDPDALELARENAVGSRRGGPGRVRHRRSAVPGRERSDVLAANLNGTSRASEASTCCRSRRRSSRAARATKLDGGGRVARSPPRARSLRTGAWSRLRRVVRARDRLRTSVELLAVAVGQSRGPAGRARSCRTWPDCRVSHASSERRDGRA